MPKVTVNETTITIGPSIELEEYKWLKVSVSVSFIGDFDKALKEAEYRYWRAVLLELRLRKDIETSYEDGQLKGLKRKAESKMERLEGSLSKYK